MKRYFFIALFAVVPLVAFSQEKVDKYSLELPKDNMIEVNGGFLMNKVVRFEENSRIGNADNGSGYSFGVTYSRKLTDKLWVGGGYNYMQFKNDYVSITTPIITEEKTSNMWSIPLFAKYNFVKWAYVKPGFAFDFQYNNKDSKLIDNQSGISVFVAAGVNFKVWKSFNLAVEPKVGLTSLAAFKGDSYQQHFIYYGGTINVNYLF